MAPRDARPYVPVEQRLPTNKKLAGADARAKWLYVVALCWCGQELNDGIFTPRVVVALADVPARFVKDLIDRDLWHGKGHACTKCPQPTNPDEVVVHDYLEHNRSSGRVRQILDARTLAGRRANHERWKHAGSFDECEVCNE